MPELITLTAHVPSDRVPEYYEVVAALNRLSPDRLPELHELLTALNRPQSNASNKQSTQPWSKGDKRLAKQVLEACSPNAQKVLSYLADRPDQKVLGAEIAMTLGMTKGHMAIAGTLGPIGIHCKKFGRDMPYETHYDVGATAAHYVMSKEVTELFKSAASGA